ncbi:SIMPL domain-containing protein [Pedococcus sp. NPDC057267]|uniref:SIMPL domain-containing protein n=1 Tax=Pedococcus sp. NPDC057267 TaxID=3346077 RepID=UPI003631ED70
MTEHMDVTGTGRASAVPDVVRVSAGVRCEASDVSAALSDAAGRAAALAQAARDHGVDERDLRTTSSGVQPRYDRDGTSVVGYSAQQGLAVTVRDPALVGALVDAFAGAAGSALTIDSVGTDLADPAPLLAAAREAAFADALAKAEQYAPRGPWPGEGCARARRCRGWCPAPVRPDGGRRGEPLARAGRDYGDRDRRGPMGAELTWRASS